MTNQYRFLDSSLLGSPLKNEHTIVVGAGIAGLFLGYYLKKSGIPFKIYEKSHRPGGLLGSQKCTYGIAEQAANGFLWCQPIVDLCADLGIELLQANGAESARYLVRNRQLHKMPLSFPELSKAVKNAVLPKNRDKNKVQTLRDFGETYFSSSFTNHILEPAMLGIYNGLASELSFPGTMKSIAELLNENKSLVFGGMKKSLFGKKNPNKIGGTLSFKNGVQELVDALADFLKGDIEYDSIPDKEFVQKNNSVLCVPAYVAKDYVDGTLHDLLAQIEYSKNISITSFVKKTDLERFKPGFGCLISRADKMRILGVLFNSCIFGNRVVDKELVSLTCITRDFDGSLFALNDADLLKLVNEDLDILLGLKAAPLEQVLFRWERGIPIYTPALYENWFVMDDLLKKDYQNLRLFGNYTGQISIRGMCEMAAAVV